VSRTAVMLGITGAGLLGSVGVPRVSLTRSR
jgi:hypothetical protein